MAWVMQIVHVGPHRVRVLQVRLAAVSMGGEYALGMRIASSDRMRLHSILALGLLIGCLPVPSRVPSPFGQPTTAGPMTTQGVILSVERPRPEDNQAFVHVVITPADQRPIRLVLAPGWYLEERGLRFEPRQTVEVRGKRVVQNGESSIVVQSLRQGGRSYVLRDEREQPAWLKP